MSTSMFSPESFLQSTFEGTKFDTKRPVLPDGDYPAVCTEVSPPRIMHSDRGDQYVWDIKFKLDHPHLEAEIGRKDSVMTYGVFLDLSPDGGLDMGVGKNVSLGQLLEAFDLNGKNWAPQDLPGKVCVVKVKSGVSKNTGEQVSNIRGIAHA